MNHNAWTQKEEKKCHGQLGKARQRCSEAMGVGHLVPAGHSGSALAACNIPHWRYGPSASFILLVYGSSPRVLPEIHLNWSRKSEVGSTNRRAFNGPKSSGSERAALRLQLDRELAAPLSRRGAGMADFIAIVSLILKFFRFYAALVNTLCWRVSVIVCYRICVLFLKRKNGCVNTHQHQRRDACDANCWEQLFLHTN